MATLFPPSADGGRSHSSTVFNTIFDPSRTPRVCPQTEITMAALRRIVKSTATIVGVSLCTILLAIAGPVLLLMFLAWRWDATDDWTSVSTGQAALECIARERSGSIPKSASDFYFWDEGFLNDHTTYWSFKCKTLSDCKLAAAPVRSDFHSGPILTDDDFREWTLPEFDFVVSGPGYFGSQHSSDKWDITGIRHGTSAIRIDYDSRDSELQFSAIDLETLRVYRLRWYGSSLTSKLKELGYNHEVENVPQGKKAHR